MPNNKPKVVIIVPTYNERDNVARLIPLFLEKIFPPLEKDYQPQVLFVDDTSPDKTSEVIQEFVRQSTQVHLLINTVKGGLGKAYIAGMNHALQKLKADIVFEFDADLSHDPTKIQPMLERLSQGYDMVLGSRYIKGGSIPKDWGWHRKFLSIVGNLVIQVIMTHFAVRDWTTGFRGIKRHVVEAVLPEMNEAKFTGYTFQIGFLHKAIRKGFKIAEVPIHFIDRTQGESKLGPEYIANNLKYILKVRFQEITTHRLFRFGVVGVIGAVVQLSTLALYRRFFPFQVAYFLGVEMAVISNFIWSSLWTFSDRPMTWAMVPEKFILFNLASAGSIIIQQVVAIVGQHLIGLRHVFTLPFFSWAVDTGSLFAIVGILLGMTWNYLAYSRVIWKNKAVAASKQARK